MRVLEPKDLENRRQNRAKKQKTGRRKRSLLPFLSLLVISYIIFALVVPLPALQAKTSEIPLPLAVPVSLSWPAYGQAAVSAVGYGLLAQNGEQKPQPIASVAKVITALAVMKVRPMQPGTQGEILTITRADVATYNAYASQGQSVVAVQAGEQLTQYQALQALLLPSANNMADVLVRWAFGSNEEYLTFVNPFVATLGLENTTIADASGFSPQTVSTAVDLAKLGELAMNHPTIAEIVAQPQARLPVAGIVYNVNSQLGKAGVVGIKTGNTDQAGGCYLAAANYKLDETHSITVVTAVIGAPNRDLAIQSTLPLLDSASKHFSVITPVIANQALGQLTGASGVSTTIAAKTPATLVSWAGQATRAEFTISPQGSSVKAGENVGTLMLHVGNNVQTVELVAMGNLNAPSAAWRLRYAGGHL